VRIDLLENDYFGPIGDLQIWADALCCEDPVSTDTRSFDAIKSLFR